MRRLLDHDLGRLIPRIRAALAAGRARTDPRFHDVAIGLGAWRRLSGARRTAGASPAGPAAGFPPLRGARQILDALLVVGEDGHAPGTRVVMLASPRSGRPGTILGAVWGPAGPPVRYEVHPDGGTAPVMADPGDLVLLDPEQARQASI